MNSIKNAQKLNSESQHPIPKRYCEFDILRTFSMIFIVMVHSWEELEPFVYLPSETFYDHFSYLYAIIGPSVLMLCLGTNLSFGSSKSPRDLALRGLSFLCLDVLLNIARFGIPAILLACLGKPKYISFFVTNLLGSDIYAFVGAFFLLYALFRKLRLSSISMIFIAICMLTANTFLDYTNLNFENSGWLSYLMGRLIFTGSNSFFPLLPWFIFPAVGFHFGNIFQSMTEAAQRSFVRRLFVGCIIGLTAMCVALLCYDISPRIANITKTHYQTDLFSTTLMILLAGIVFGMAHKTVTLWPDSLFVKACRNISKHMVPFYMIQWIIIGWIELFFKAFHLYGIFYSPRELNLLAVLILFISLYLAFRFTKWKSRQSEKSV